METEQQANTTGPPVVMAARAFSDGALERAMYIPAGLIDNVLLTKTRGINADFADLTNVFMQE